MTKLAQQPWLLGIVSAGLLLLPFSIMGPVPFWRTFFAWLAFVPILFGLLSRRNLSRPRAVVRGTLAAYLMGVLWFAGNCYWIYQTMLYFGGLPPLISAGILIAYSMVLGLYFATFGLLLTTTAKAFRSPIPALLAAPFYWVALELLSARFTQVPWDTLGYSQIDNYPVNQSGSVHRGLRAQLRADRRQRAHRLRPPGLVFQSPHVDPGDRPDRRTRPAKRRPLCAFRRPHPGHRRPAAAKP